MLPMTSLWKGVHRNLSKAVAARDVPALEGLFARSFALCVGPGGGWGARGVATTSGLSPPIPPTRWQPDGSSGNGGHVGLLLPLLPLPCAGLRYKHRIPPKSVVDIMKVFAGAGKVSLVTNVYKFVSGPPSSGHAVANG